MTNKLIKDLLLPILKKYKQDKEMEGYLPTIELLIEDLENNEYATNN